MLLCRGQWPIAKHKHIIKQRASPNQAILEGRVHLYFKTNTRRLYFTSNLIDKFEKQCGFRKLPFYKKV